MPEAAVLADVLVLVAVDAVALVDVVAVTMVYFTVIDLTAIYLM